jgi:hypothetical protein
VINLNFFQQNSKDMLQWWKMLVRFFETNSIMAHLFCIGCVFTVFLLKYFSFMMLKNRSWRYGLWYSFLENPPHSIGSAGLLDPTAMAAYKKTLSISLGHQLVAKLNQLFGFEMGLAILYVIIGILVVISIYLLALHISHSKINAFLVTFLLVNTDFLAMAHVGACGHLGQTAVRDYLALGFFLFAIYFLFERRIYLYWLCFLIGFLCHMSHGLMAFCILLPITLLSVESIRFKFFHILSFGFIISCIYIYQSIGSEPINSDYLDLWFKWSYLFNGGHIYWDHSINYLAPTYAFFSVVAASISLAVVYPNKRVFLFSIVASWGVLAICVSFFIYIVPMAIIYKLTPLRSSLLISSLILIFLFVYLCRVLLEDRRLERLMASAVAIFASVTGTFIGIFFMAGITCILAGFDSVGNKRKVCFSLTLVIGLLFILCISQILTYDISPMRQNIVLLFVLLTLLVAYVFFKDAPIKNNLRLIAVCIVVTVALFYISSIPSRYVSPPSSESIDKLKEYLIASELIKKHTLEANPVLTAPLIYMPRLEVTASRGSIFQLPKAAVVYMAPKLLPAMNEALKDLGIDISLFNGTWVDLIRDAPNLWKKNATKDSLLKLSKKYNAPYVLTYADHELDLPVMYEGKYFNVFNLRDTNEKSRK